MEIPYDLVIILFLLLGMIAGMIIMRIVSGRIRKPVVGTLIIDMRNSAKDICRFVMDKDLDTISKYDEVTIKVTRLVNSDKPLESFKDYD